MPPFPPPDRADPDDRAGQTNYNNVYSLISRVDNGCWGMVGQSVEAHELMHNLGGFGVTTAISALFLGHVINIANKLFAQRFVRAAFGK